jgi:hypothetical protein
VNTFSRHERLSYLSYFSYRRVAASIPAEIPIILEALVQPEEIEREVQFAIECLTPAPAREAGSATPVLSPAPARGD